MSVHTTKTTAPLNAPQRIFLLLDNKGQYVLWDQATFIEKFDAFKAATKQILQPFAFCDVNSHYSITTQEISDDKGANQNLRTDQYLTDHAGNIIEHNWHVWPKNAECFGMRSISDTNKRQPIAHELKYLILAHRSSFGQDLGTPEALTFDKATTHIEKQSITKLVASLRA